MNATMPPVEIKVLSYAGITSKYVTEESEMHYSVSKI
jgi:hypothetical protein